MHKSSDLAHHPFVNSALHILFVCGLVMLPPFLVMGVLSLNMAEPESITGLLPLCVACSVIAVAFFMLRRNDRFNCVETLKVFQPIWRSVLSLVVGAALTLVVVHVVPGWDNMSANRTASHVAILYYCLATAWLLQSLLVLLGLIGVAHVIGKVVR